jgi:hypothetical protein
MDNPYAAPLEKNQQPTQRSRFAFLIEITWAFCASLPILWFCAMFSYFLIYGDSAPPSLFSRFVAYATLLVCLLLFTVSFVYNVLAALKRRWAGIVGVVINLMSLALIIFIGVMVALVAMGRL